MAQVQYFYARRKDAPSTAQTGTATYDLPRSGFIPEILLQVYATPTASTDPALPVNDAITKIEIVDGATVIKSISGNHAHALEMIHVSRERSSPEVNDNAVAGRDFWRLVLGKELSGVNYAPDFSKFSNPQLKVTWDHSITTGAHGATFDADTAPVTQITALCKVVRGTSKYTHGFIKSVIVRTFTSVASATVKTELPRGEKMIGIMVDAGYDDDDWTEDVEQLKLEFNNGEWVPVDLYEDEIVPFHEMIHGGKFSVSFKADIKDAVELDVHMGWVGTISFEATGTADQYTASWPDSRIGIEEVSIFDSKGAADATYRQWQVAVTGQLPYQCFYLPMSAVLNGEGDFVDTSKYRDIHVTIVQGSSPNTASTPDILCEYLVTS